MLKIYINNHDRQNFYHSSLQCCFSSLRFAGIHFCTTLLRSDHSNLLIATPFLSVSVILLQICCCVEDRWPHVKYFCIQFMVDRFYGCRTRPNPQPSTTMLNSWYEVVPEVLCFVQVQLSKLMVCLQRGKASFHLVCLF